MNQSTQDKKNKNKKHGCTQIFFFFNNDDMECSG